MGNRRAPRRRAAELETQVLDVAGLARLNLARRAIRSRRKPGVAHAAATAFRDQDALAFPGQIGDQAVRRIDLRCSFGDQRPDRDGELEIGAAVAGAVRAHAVLAPLGLEFRMKSEVDQGVDVRAGDQVDRPAVSAVAAARPAARHELLAPEGQTPATAMTGLDVNVDFVYKHAVGDLVNLRIGDSPIHQFPTHQLFWRLNADDPAVRAVVLELHATVDLREDRVVLADPGESRAEPPSALPHDDGAAADDVPVVRLDAEPLRIRVAAVAGTCPFL